MIKKIIDNSIIILSSRGRLFFENKHSTHSQCHEISMPGAGRGGARGGVLMREGAFRHGPPSRRDVPAVELLCPTTGRSHPSCIPHEWAEVPRLCIGYFSEAFYPSQPGLMYDFVSTLLHYRIIPSHIAHRVRTPTGEYMMHFTPPG